jgi:hypothetical protein
MRALSTGKYGTTDQAPAMINSNNGFLLHHKNDESFLKFILYDCVVQLDVLSATVIPFKHVLDM